MLCLVERQAEASPGFDAAGPLVSSRRSNQEKPPWRELAGVRHRVEAEFLRPVLLGEAILPYRIFRTTEGVIPVSGTTVLDAQGAARHGFAGLHGWMSAAEALWDTNAGHGHITLTGRWNRHDGLAAQFPLAPLRVVYAASAEIPAACLVRGSPAVVEHGVYWSEVATEDEGRFLVAVLNSETTRLAVRELHARGLGGTRHIDKVVFTLPIPRFDRSNALHGELAATADEAEQIAAMVDVPRHVRFQRARHLMHDALATVGVAERIDWLVAQLLSG
jgi:hypothetical protein